MRHEILPFGSHAERRTVFRIMGDKSGDDDVMQITVQGNVSDSLANWHSGSLSEDRNQPDAM